MRSSSCRVTEDDARNCTFVYRGGRGVAGTAAYPRRACSAASEEPAYAVRARNRSSVEGGHR